MNETSDPVPPGTQAANDSDDAALVALARKVYDDRRRRAQIPGTCGLFGEPAWDILVHLFIAACDNRSETIAAVCESAATPESTALRWIAILEKRGLITYEGETALKLTLKAYAGLADHFRRS